MKYILDENHNPVLLDGDDLIAWATWYGKAENRVVRQEDVEGYMVSTIFLALDHNFAMSGPPILFETMVFHDGATLDYQTRCSTWDEALAMHTAGVEHVQALIGERMLAGSWTTGEFE